MCVSSALRHGETTVCLCDQEYGDTLQAVSPTVSEQALVHKVNTSM